MRKTTKDSGIRPQTTAKNIVSNLRKQRKLTTAHTKKEPQNMPSSPSPHPPLSPPPPPVSHPRPPCVHTHSKTSHENSFSLSVFVFRAHQFQKCLKLKSDFVVPRLVLDQIKTRATHHLSVLPRALRPCVTSPLRWLATPSQDKSTSKPTCVGRSAHQVFQSVMLRTFVPRSHLVRHIKNSTMKKRGENVFSTVHECVTHYQRKAGNLEDKTRQLDAETQS